MKKHFALYFTHIVNAMINAIEKHNGIPFRKMVTVWGHQKIAHMKTVLISFASDTSFFCYSIGIMQFGHIVRVQLFKSTTRLTIDEQNGVINDEAAETIAWFYLGKEQASGTPVSVVPTIFMPHLPQEGIRLDVPVERTADMVQALILVSNLFREIATIIAWLSPVIKEYDSFKVDEVEYPNIVEEAQKEIGLTEASS